MKTNKLKGIVLTLFVMLFIGCIQSCSTEESLLENDATITTVTKEEAIQFLKKEVTTIGISGKNVNLNFDFDKVTQEKLTNTSELLTVVPLKTKTKNQRIRALILKVGHSVESILYNEYPEAFSTKKNFTGIILMTKINGDFIRAYRLKDNKYDVELGPVKGSKTNKLLFSKDVNAIEKLEEVIIMNNYKKPNPYVSMNELGKELPIEALWDPSGGGGSGGETTEEDEEDVVDVEYLTKFPPSCEIFNFVKTTGLWQVALVKNVRFKVLLVNEEGVEILHRVAFSQPISFGTPTNIQMGDTDITPGLAANASARALQKSMQDVIDRYGHSRTSDLTLRLYFQERLKHNYPLYIPGARVNFNATENIVATEYKTNPWTAGNCN